MAVKSATPLRGFYTEILDFVGCKRHKTIHDLRAAYSIKFAPDYYVYRGKVLEPLLFENPNPNHPMYKEWVKSAGIDDGLNFDDLISFVNFFKLVAKAIGPILLLFKDASTECEKVETRWVELTSKCQSVKKFNFDKASKLIREDALYKIIRKYSTISCEKEIEIAAYIICTCVFFDENLKCSDLTPQQMTLKEGGNDSFKARDYDMAIKTYSKLIGENQYCDIIYSNRAEAYLRLGKYREAELDATRAIILNPHMCKAYKKLALAYEGQKKLDQVFLTVGESEELCPDLETCRYHADIILYSRTLREKFMSSGRSFPENNEVSKDIPSSMPELIDDSDEDEGKPALLGDKSLALLKIALGDISKNYTQIVLKDLSQAVVQDKAQAVLQDKAQEVLEDKAQAVLQDKAQAVLQDKAQAVLQDKAQAVLQDKAQAVLQDKAQAVLQDKAQAVLQDKAQAVLQDKAQAVLQDKSQAVLEDKSQAVLEDKSQAVLEDKSQAVLEDKAQEVLEDKAQEVLEDKAQEVLEDKAQEVLEDKAQEVLEDKAQEVLEDKAQEVLEDKSQSVPEDKSQAVPEDKSQAVPEDKSQAVPEDKSQAVPEDKSQAVPEDKSQAVPEDKSQAVPEDKSQAVPEDKSQAVPEDKSQAVPEDKSQAVPEDKSQAVPEDKSQAVPEDKSQTVLAEKSLENGQALEALLLKNVQAFQKAQIVLEVGKCKEDEEQDVACNNNTVTLLKSFRNKTKRGSEFLLVNNECSAVEEYEEALTIADSLEYFLYKKDLLTLKYALGISYAAGDFQSLEKALHYFEDIEKNHNHRDFPAVFYATGLVLIKLFRFDEALLPLKHCQELIKNVSVLKQYDWPGTEKVIDKTIKERLEEELSELIYKCRYAPKPDAVCRLNSCPYTRNIYYTDPNIRGCYQLFCTGNCHVEYHFQCWRRVRDEMGKTEKDFLDNSCPTPDCENVVYLIQIISKNGEIQNTFESAIHGKHKQKVPKHRKSKLERKTETRSIKKRKKLEKVKKPLKDGEKEAQYDPEDDEYNPNETEWKDVPTESTAGKENIPLNNEQPNQIIYELNAEPTYVFKKEDIVEGDSASNKQAPKTREKKCKPKKAVLSIDEFCKDAILSSAPNPYLERIQHLQITKELMEDIDISENNGSENHTFRQKLNNDHPVHVENNDSRMTLNNSSISKDEDIEPVPTFENTKADLCRNMYNNSCKPKPNEASPTLFLPTEPKREYETIRQLSENMDDQAFQLQVTLFALPEELQLNLVAGIFNNFSNNSKFWEKLSEIVDFKEVLQLGSRDPETSDIFSLRTVIKNLNDDTKNLRDANVKQKYTFALDKNKLEEEIQDWQLKFNNLVLEMKGLKISHDSELKRLNHEKQKMQDQINNLMKENEGVKEVENTVEKLLEQMSETQKELTELKRANEMASSTNETLLEQVTGCQETIKKVSESLINERKNMEMLIFKIAEERISENIQRITKQMEHCAKSANSLDYFRLNNIKDFQLEHFKIIESQRKNFLDKMNECLNKLNRDERNFKIDDIPAIPIVPPILDSKPPGFHNANTNTGAMQGLLPFMMNNRPPLFPNPPPIVNRFMFPTLPPPTGNGAFANNNTMPLPHFGPPGIQPSQLSSSSSASSTSLPVSPGTSRRSSSTSSLYDQLSPINLPSQLVASPKHVASKCETSSKAQSQSAKGKSSFDKIVQMIKHKLPYLSENEINAYIKAYRATGERFTGKLNEDIAKTLTEYILSDESASPLGFDAKHKTKPILKDMSSVIPPVCSSEPTIAKMWKINDKPSGNFKTKDCTICFEPITKGSAYQAECGHNCFHETCVRPWLMENSSCPICRKYLLLPEEFPKL